MWNTLLIFIDKYYEYKGSIDTNKRDLPIKGCDSARLSDLVVSCLLDNLEDLLESNQNNHVIYIDDSVIFLDENS